MVPDRPLDPLLVAAYAAQAALVGTWIATLTDADLAAPSLLPGWRIGELVAHLTRSGRVVTGAELAPRGSTPRSLAAYVAGYPAAADAITARPTATAEGLTIAAANAAFRASAQAVKATLERLAADPVLSTVHGPVRLSDLLRTRVLELVVHSLDAEPGPARDRQAVRVAARALAQVLGERHGGKAIEVRVPPYAAVQIGEGVTHTRGTPPNVVEFTPEVWVALAAGRRPWAAAVAAGEVRASGTRADLTGYLPLL